MSLAQLPELRERGFVLVENFHTLAPLDAWLQAYLQGPVRIVTAGLRAPEAGQGLQGLHQDFPRQAPGAPPSVLTCLLFLDDFGPDNGATGLIPGSHRWPQALPKSQQQPAAEHPDEIQLTGKANTALLFDGHLWHRGRTNHSGLPRRAVQLQYALSR